MVSIVIIWVVKKLQNRHHLWEDRGRMKEWQTTIQVTTISSVIRVCNVPHVLQAYVKPKVNLQGHPVTSLHGKIVPRQIVPLNSQIVPQYSQNVSRVFKLRAKQEHHSYCKPLYACKMPDSFPWPSPQGSSYYYSEHIKHHEDFFKSHKQVCQSRGSG